MMTDIFIEHLFPQILRIDPWSVLSMNATSKTWYYMLRNYPRMWKRLMTNDSFLIWKTLYVSSFGLAGGWRTVIPDESRTQGIAAMMSKRCLEERIWILFVLRAQVHVNAFLAGDASTSIGISFKRQFACVQRISFGNLSSMVDVGELVQFFTTDGTALKFVCSAKGNFVQRDEFFVNISHLDLTIPTLIRHPILLNENVPVVGHQIVQTQDERRNGVKYVSLKCGKFAFYFVKDEFKEARELILCFARYAYLGKSNVAQPKLRSMSTAEGFVSNAIRVKIDLDEAV